MCIELQQFFHTVTFFIIGWLQLYLHLASSYHGKITVISTNICYSLDLLQWNVYFVCNFIDRTGRCYCNAFDVVFAMITISCLQHHLLVLVFIGPQ
jgi:hypothetical protein